MSHSQHITEAEKTLIKDCINGKEIACRQLFETYYSRFFAICKRYTKDEDDAKDVVQDGYIKIFHSLKDYNAEGSFEGWMKRIMINTSINHYRKHKTREITDYIGDDIKEQDAGDGLIAIDSALSSLATQHLLKLIQQLPPVYRMIFNLFVIEGYSHKEIATLLNITESTSRANLVKARAKLQNQLIQLQHLEKISHAG
jgi:RNA polymerase sigma factor (sigma-70 family)